jgi:hypothetical protein
VMSRTSGRASAWNFSWVINVKDDPRTNGVQGCLPVSSH